MPDKTELKQALPLTVPRQHGAWTVAIASLLAGAGVAGKISLPLTILALAVGIGLCSRHAIGLLLRLSPGDPRRAPLRALALAYSSVFLAAGAVLILGHGLWLLLPIGVIGTAVAVSGLANKDRNSDFTLKGQLQGIFGLSLVAPAAEYCASGDVTQQTLGLWLLCLAFFAGRPFHVRFFTRQPVCTAPLRDRWQAAQGDVLFHLAVLGLATALGPLAGLLPNWAPLPLALPTLAALGALAVRRQARRPIARIGRVELVHAVIFLGLVVMVFRA